MSIVNFRKTYRLLATCLDISLYAPKTDDKVSSINDIIDFLKPLFEELILLLLSIFLLLLVFLRGLEFLNLLNYILLGRSPRVPVLLALCPFS